MTSCVSLVSDVARFFEGVLGRAACRNTKKNRGKIGRRKVGAGVSWVWWAWGLASELRWRWGAGVTGGVGVGRTTGTKHPLGFETTSQATVDNMVYVSSTAPTCEFKAIIYQLLTEGEHYQVQLRPSATLLTTSNIPTYHDLNHKISYHLPFMIPCTIKQPS